VKRTVVESSTIASFGYNHADRIMEIEFRNGTVYRYFDVKPQDHIGFLTAPSKGAFFQTRIHRVYRYECVDPERQPRRR
jgi:hypothetical protein